MTNELWQKIINDIRQNPRDLRTIPLNDNGIWFHVHTDGYTIYVDNAKTKTPSSRLTQTRCVHKEEFQKMYDIYLRRKKGEQVSQEATKITRNIVYIYSIFCNCGGI